MLRKLTDRFLTYIGLGLVFGAMLGSELTQLRGVLILLGLVLVQLGIWNIARRMFGGRKATALRRDVAHFVLIVREAYNNPQADYSEMLTGQCSAIIRALKREHELKKLEK